MLDENAAPRALLLPPPYTAHWAPRGDVMAQACARAAQDGAGTLVWHMSAGQGDAAGRLDFAVVLEPEEPLAQARRAFIAGMVALGDALAAHCPPERAVRFGWPGEVRLDGGRLGGMRFAAPGAGEVSSASGGGEGFSASGGGEGDVPEWMVLGIELIADRDHLSAAGTRPDSVSLREEEFTDPPAVVESFAAYLMLMFDRWRHAGFETLAARYSERLDSGAALDEAGALLRDDGSESLADAVGRTYWRDDAGPRL